MTNTSPQFLPTCCRGFSVPGNVRRVRCDALDALSSDYRAGAADTEEAEEAIAHAGVQVSAEVDAIVESIAE